MVFTIVRQEEHVTSILKVEAELAALFMLVS
jgi:hypothetical protein